MVFGKNNVHWITYKTRFLCKMYFLEKLNRRNSLIAKISLTAKLLQEQFANSENYSRSSSLIASLRQNFQLFPKAVSSSLGFVGGYWGLSSQYFTQYKPFMISSNECTLHPTILKERGMDKHY